jgi:antitoxin CptB
MRQMNNMCAENEYNRLLWQCRRGMLELDILLLAFVENNFKLLNLDEIDVLKRLLAENDQILAKWFLGNINSSDEELAKLVIRIRNFKVIPS